MILTSDLFANLRKTANDLISFGFRSDSLSSNDRFRTYPTERMPPTAKLTPAAEPGEAGAMITMGQLNQIPVRITAYDSLVQLGRQLKEIEADPDLPRPTVVLVLSRCFAGDIPSLIQRSTWTPRLAIVAERGSMSLPRGMMPGDLAACEGALGWGQIVFEQDLDAALTGSLQSLVTGESLIVCWPAGQCPSVPMALLQRNGCQLSSTR